MFPDGYFVSAATFVSILIFTIPDFFVLYFLDGIMALEEDQFILIDDPLPDVA